MKTICTWYHVGAPVVLSDDGVPDGQVSHGICPECIPRFEAGERPITTEGTDNEDRTK